MMRKLTGEILIADMVHTCQERIVSYHRQGFEAEQAGEREKADVYYCLSSQYNQLLQQYWEAGAQGIIDREEVRS